MLVHLAHKEERVSTAATTVPPAAAAAAAAAAGSTTAVEQGSRLGRVLGLRPSAPRTPSVRQQLAVRAHTNRIKGSNEQEVGGGEEDDVETTPPPRSASQVTADARRRGRRQRAHVDRLTLGAGLELDRQSAWTHAPSRYFTGSIAIPRPAPLPLTPPAPASPQSPAEKRRGRAIRRRCRRAQHRHVLRLVAASRV